MSRVRDAMVRGVVAVASDTSLAAVARLFALNDVSAAPVIEDSGLAQSDAATSDDAGSGFDAGPGDAGTSAPDGPGALSVTPASGMESGSVRIRER